MKKFLIKKFIVILVLLLFPILSSAQSQSVESECLPFATSQWVLTNQKTGQLGQVVEMFFNPPGTCQFKLEYPDGTWDYKVVLSVSERERIRTERLNEIETQKGEEVKTEWQKD